MKIMLTSDVDAAHPMYDISDDDGMPILTFSTSDGIDWYFRVESVAAGRKYNAKELPSVLDQVRHIFTSFAD